MATITNIIESYLIGRGSCYLNLVDFSTNQSPIYSHNSLFTRTKFNEFQHLINYSWIEDCVPVYLSTKPKMLYEKKTILAPFFVSNTFTRRTFNSSLKMLYNYSDAAQYQLSNYTYYGNVDFILDENYIPIIVRCLKPEIASETIMTFSKMVFYINPIIFLNQTDVLYKFMVQKVIPTLYKMQHNNFSACVKTTPRFNTFYSMAGTYTTIPVEMRISDKINNFIISPQKPKDILHIDEHLQGVLESQIKELSFVSNEQKN